MLWLWCSRHFLKEDLAAVSVDAACLGIPIILSDIAVNREVDADHLFFFQAGDCIDLAEKMMLVAKMTPVRSSRESLSSRGHMRAERLGNALMGAIDVTLRAYSGKLTQQ